MSQAKLTAVSRRIGLERDGSDTLLQRARPAVLALTLAKHGWLAVLIFGVPFAWAAAEQVWDLAAALLGAIAGGVLPAALTWRAALPRDLRQVEAMCALALMFFFSALLAVPAFVTLGLAPLPALFDGMSAITTTGLSLAPDPDAWPMSAHILRAWMQWCGGLVMATAVLALILSPGGAAHQMGQAGIDQGDRIANTRAQARQLLGVYAGLTAVCALPILVTVPDWREAIALTLSAISTGGFAPRSDSLASYSVLAQTCVISVCIAGTVSLLTWVFLARGKARAALGLQSLARVGLVLALGTALYGTWLTLSSDAPVWPELLNLYSAMTTAGYSTGAMPVSGPILLLFVGVMVLGGDGGSTAGGLKLNRGGMLGRAMQHGLRRPRLPDSAVAPLRQRGKPVDMDMLIALLALGGLYGLTLIVLWAGLLATGAEALPALFDTVSALSTVGLSTGVINPDLPDALIAAFTFAMWLGRLEFIAVLLLVLPRTWLKRS